MKAFFSAPVRGVNAQNFTLTDSRGVTLPAWVDQIGDGAWGLFPNDVTLRGGETYTARLARGICDFAGTCTSDDLVWTFKVAVDPEDGTGDTSIPPGFLSPEKRRDHSNQRK